MTKKDLGRVCFGALLVGASAIVASCGGDDDDDDPSGGSGGAVAGSGGSGGTAARAGNGGTAGSAGEGGESEGGGGTGGAGEGGGGLGGAGEGGGGLGGAGEGGGGAGGAGEGGGGAGGAGEGGGGVGGGIPDIIATTGPIDDLEDGDNAVLPPYVGYWFTRNDGTGTQTPPPDPSGTSPFPPTPGGSTSPLYAACTQGSGFTAWGAYMGFLLNDVGSNRLGRVNANGVVGIRFRIRGTGSVQVLMATTASSSPAYGGTCTGVGCDVHPGAPLTLSSDWATVGVLFSQLAPGSAPFSPSQLLSIVFAAHAPGGGLVPAFDFCVDDLEFI